MAVACIRWSRVISTRCFWLLLALAPAAVLAQVTSATILGTVQDASGAFLPGVSVTIVNEETGISRVVVSDQSGRYLAPQLALGNQYRVQAELQGFKTVIRRGIALTLGREAVVDLTLTIGDVTESVVVIGEAPLVDTTNARVAGRVDERQIRELPMNARSYIDLSLLQAGTIQARTASGTSFGDTGTHLTVAGARPTATTFLLDGTVNDLRPREGAGERGGHCAWAWTPSASSKCHQPVQCGVRPRHRRHDQRRVQGRNQQVARQRLRVPAQQRYGCAQLSSIRRRGHPTFNRYQFGAAMGGAADPESDVLLRQL